MTGYLYILKHGIGPGTMPNDVTILKEKDLPNYYTAVWLDRFLTTSELKQYDIPSETRINELLSRIDYCQADNGDDVVPCDEVEACGNVMASEYPSGPEFNKLCDYYAGLDPWISLEEIWDMVNADHGNEYGLADDITAYVEDYRNCVDEGIDPDDVDACDNINASTKSKYFANMVNCSSDPELDDDFLIEGYYDSQRRGLAESAETSDVSALNDLANEYANKGYYIVVYNLTDGVITEFSADNWFNDIAPDGGAELFMSW